MKTVRIAAGRPYEVLIGDGLIRRCGELVSQVHRPCPLALVTDDGIPEQWITAAELSLHDAGFSVYRLCFPHGEEHKTMTTVAQLLEKFSGIPLTRGDLVVALGGGIVGDTAGFAASCYMRGVPFIQIPTTLLAAVDSSVGGKTAVNLAAGKNLAGSFWQPLRVICDLEIIAAVPRTLWVDGAAECVKYGMLADPALFDLLRAGRLKEDLETVVTRCVEIKSQLVAEDERDTGRRQLLNLGHTLGHAIERASGFTVSHGHGVAIGMVLITRAAALFGHCEPSCLFSLTDALKACGLFGGCPFGSDQLLDAALHDKKRVDSTITLVVPRQVGQAVLLPIPVGELRSWIDAGLNTDNDAGFRTTAR